MFELSVRRFVDLGTMWDMLKDKLVRTFVGQFEEALEK